MRQSFPRNRKASACGLMPGGGTLRREIKFVIPKGPPATTEKAPAMRRPFPNTKPKAYSPVDTSIVLPSSSVT